MSRRTEQVGSTIRKELAQMILRDLNDPRLVGMPSITRVKLSADLSVADVYVTIMGTAGQQSAALNALRHSAGLMRSKLTKALSMRVVPFLKFHIDEHLKKELAILELLQKVSQERAAKEAAGSDAAAVADGSGQAPVDADDAAADLEDRTGDGGPDHPDGSAPDENAGRQP